MINSFDAKLFVYSKILAILSFYNKNVILNNLFKSFDEEKLKRIAIYEYKNNTNVSINSKIFDKYASKYKKEAYDNLMIEDNSDELKNTKKEYNKMFINKNKNILLFFCIIMCLIFTIIFGYEFNKYNKMIKKYDNKIFKGIYLDDLDLSGVKINDLSNIINEEKNSILSSSIKIKNINEEQSFSVSDIGVTIDTDKTISEIKSYNKNLSYFDKIKYIKGKKKLKVFYLESELSNNLLDEFIIKLKNALNNAAKDDGLVIDDNYNVTYSKGTNGFTLNEEESKKIIKNKIEKLTENMVITVSGDVIKNDVKYESLSKVDTKVSSYTTYFVNAGNRGHNINLASKRLNGTVVMPNDVFSYFSVIGPYGSSNGYLPAPVYLNSEVKTENGGGVCQLASTLYNATLRSGLETISRRGHTFAPNYVPKGLDATVYGTTTDFKFKNNYEYPVYIVSYIKGNYLTVDIWTNSNALSGYSYEPYSIYSNGGYLAYLKVIKDGQMVETKYLDKSTYKVHP